MPATTMLQLKLLYRDMQLRDRLSNWLTDNIEGSYRAVELKVPRLSFQPNGSGNKFREVY